MIGYQKSIDCLMCHFLCVSTTGESVVPEQEDEVEESEGRTVVFAQRPGKRRHGLGRLAQLRMNGGGRTPTDGCSTGRQANAAQCNPSTISLESCRNQTFCFVLF